jgi:hypothetical protein
MYHILIHSTEEDTQYEIHQIVFHVIHLVPKKVSRIKEIFSLCVLLSIPLISVLSLTIF